MTAEAHERFSQVVQPRLDEGYRLARWLTGNSTDAEDVVQEACLRAFRAIENYADGNARAWFLAIVRNTCYSWLEQHRSRPVLSTEDLAPSDQALLESGGVAVELQPTPERVLIAKDEVGRLTRAIEALPVTLRETLVLRECHELSYRDIAEVGGVPIGTVMSRLARARQHVFAMLETTNP